MTNVQDLALPIATAMDALVEIANESDALSIEQAIDAREAIDALRRMTSVVIGFLDTQLKTLIESPVERNGRVYVVKNDGKYRPDHNRIKQALEGWALVDRSTGETFDRETAVHRAVELAYSAFVAPSTMPKRALLDQLGLDKNDVAQWEYTGKKIEVFDLERDHE